MASILKPFSNLLAPGPLQVPGGPLTIDPQHSLTNGMIGCWVPGAMGGVDLTGNIPTLTNSVNPSNSLDGTSIEGAGLNSKFVSGTNGFSVTLGNTAYPQYTAYSAISLWWRGCVYTIPDAFPNVFGVNLTASPFNIMNIGMDNLVPVHWQLQTNNAGTQSLLSGPAVTANVMHSVVATSLPGGNLNLYVDTALTGPSGIPAGPTSTASSFFTIGSIGSGTVGKFTTVIGAVWNRILSAAEVAWLQNYPYDFLIPAEYEMPLSFFPPPPPPILMLGQIQL